MTKWDCIHKVSGETGFIQELITGGKELRYALSIWYVAKYIEDSDKNKGFSEKKDQIFGANHKSS